MVGSLWRRDGQWWWDRRLRIADWLYAAGSFPFGLMLTVIPQMGFLGPLWESGLASTGLTTSLIALLVLPLFAAAALLGSAAVLFRRTRPQWLLALGFVLLAALGNFVPAVIALYSYAVYFTDRRLLGGWFALYALAMSMTMGWLTGGAAIAETVIFLVTPLVFGLWVGTRRQLVSRLQERAERLEREQHLLAEQAIGAERTRIAREMHDVVAHRVSLMVLHAGGLEVSATDERTTEAAGLIRTTGREALTELRNVLGVLRDETTAPAPTAPQPVLADLERLLGEWREAGMQVEREEAGHAPAPPQAVQRAAYRVVQEGLTNVAKHAPGSAVTVRLYHGGRELEVEVANGPAPRQDTSPPRGGFGIDGLRERLALADGELSAGACPDGGWRLRAVLPTGKQPRMTEGDEGRAGDSHTPG